MTTEEGGKAIHVVGLQVARTRGLVLSLNRASVVPSFFRDNPGDTAVIGAPFVRAAFLTLPRVFVKGSAELVDPRLFTE
jgi:hypothetical protein